MDRNYGDKLVDLIIQAVSLRISKHKDRDERDESIMDAAYVAAIIRDKYEGTLQSFTKAVAAAHVEQKKPSTSVGRWLSREWDLTAKLTLSPTDSDGTLSYDVTTTPEIQLAAVRCIAEFAGIDPKTITPLSRGFMDSKIEHYLDPYTITVGFGSEGDAQKLVDWAKGQTKFSPALQLMEI